MKLNTPEGQIQDYLFFSREFLAFIFYFKFFRCHTDRNSMQNCSCSWHASCYYYMQCYVIVVFYLVCLYFLGTCQFAPASTFLFLCTPYRSSILFLLLLLLLFVVSVMFSAQNHRHEAVDGRIGGGGGLGSHQYVHNTPTDYKYISLHFQLSLVSLFTFVDTATHTHTCLTALFPGLPRWAGTRTVKPVSILLKQETVSGSGISWAMCKSAPRARQITMPAPHHSVFYRPDALPAAQPTASNALG